MQLQSKSGSRIRQQRFHREESRSGGHSDSNSTTAHEIGSKTREGCLCFYTQ